MSSHASARYHGLRAEASAGSPAIRITAEVENHGSARWIGADGFAFSYQVYDPQTENLLVEGPRFPFDSPVEPGGSQSVDLSIELPLEPGRYRIVACPIQEDRAWFFEQGSPFVLVDAEVSDGQAMVRRVRRVTTRQMWLSRLLRTAGRAFTYPLTTILENGSLIRSMVRRDILGRYRGSYGGLFWTVIHPLLLMVTYWFVFGVVLRTRFGGDDRPSSFVLYFLAGMLPWLAFSEAVGRAATTVIDHGSFVKKLVFPVEILPVNLVLAGLFTETFGVAIFLVGMVISGREPGLSALFLPLLLVPQFLLTLGLCWFLAALGVFVRDLGQLMGFVLTVWFFITPICYPEASLPDQARWLFELNPMYVLVDGYRAIFLEGSPPEWGAFAALSAASAGVFIFGFAWFYKLKRSFADML